NEEIWQHQPTNQGRRHGGRLHRPARPEGQHSPLRVVLVNPCLVRGRPTPRLSLNELSGPCTALQPHTRGHEPGWTAPAHYGRIQDFVGAPECLLGRPGLIGIWQIYAPTFGNRRTEIALDRYNVRNWSIGPALLSKGISAANRDDRTA